MVDQASVNGHSSARGRGAGSAEYDGIAEFVDDLESLAELQAKLAAADFRDAVRKSAVPMLLVLVALTVVAASVTVALLGAGWLLASALSIQQGWAMLLIAGAGITLAGLLAALGGMMLTDSFDTFRRSRKQLRLNLAWVRTVLVTSASARLHPRRRV
jgi:hypothetical protein